MQIGLKKTLLRTIYRAGGFAPFHWAFRERVLILTYHRFSREPEPNKIPREQFAGHLSYLKRHNRVLPLSEITHYLSTGEALPPNAVAITIDDGYRDAYEVAFPLLRDFGFPATLYAVTDFIDGRCWLWTDLMRYGLFSTERDRVRIEFDNDDRVEAVLGDERQKLDLADRLNARLKKMPNERKNEKIKAVFDYLKVTMPAAPSDDFAPLDWSQAREMDAGDLKIESHTVTHPILTQIGEQQIDEELRISKERLETALNKTVEHFCYPNGAFNEKVGQAVENAGYRSAVTTLYGFNQPGARAFALNRIDAPQSIESFAQTVSGFEAFKLKIK